MPLPFRLICALLALLLALPAMQAKACLPDAGGHDAHMARVQAHERHSLHHGDAPATPAPSEMRHDCVGCIPPLDVSFYRAVEEPCFAVSLAGNPVETSFAARSSAPPEPPPPRMTV